MVAQVEDWVDTTRLVLYECYSYPGLCKCLGVDEYRDSNDRRKQRSVWEQFFRWENPSRTEYRIIEIFNERQVREDGRKNNGGARKGAGRLEKLPEEFASLLNGFLYENAPKAAMESGEPVTVRFSNADICKYFGIYAGGIFDAYEKFSELINDVEQRIAKNFPEGKDDPDRLARVEFALCDAMYAPDRVSGKSSLRRGRASSTRR